jgi:hypothetical protein
VSNPSNDQRSGAPVNATVLNYRKEILGAIIIVGYASGIVFGILPLGFTTYHTLYRDSQKYPLATLTFDGKLDHKPNLTVNTVLEDGGNKPSFICGR